MAKVEIDLKGLFFSDQLMLIAPMYHETKGLGHIAAPVTRELLYDQCPAILQMIDDATDFYRENPDEPSKKPDGASGNLRTDDRGGAVP